MLTLFRRDKFSGPFLTSSSEFVWKIEITLATMLFRMLLHLRIFFFLIESQSIELRYSLYLPACCFFFRLTAEETSAVKSSSEHPALIASLRDTSVLPKRHTFRLPSAVIRSRLHVPQKCWLMDVMKPTWPAWPSTFHAYKITYL